MKIGYITEALPYLPCRDGFRIYAANLIRCLSQKHDIDLISLLEEGDEAHLDWAGQFCASVTALPRHQQRWLTPINVISNVLWAKPLRYRHSVQDAIKQRIHNWDIIHCEGAYAGSLLPNLPVPAVLSLHDSGTLRCAEMLKCSHGLITRSYYRWLALVEPLIERQLYPRFGRCVVVAKADLAEVQRVVPSAEVEVIPNGTDTEYYRPQKAHKKSADLAFHGNLSYPPNVKAALEFGYEILPRVMANTPAVVFHLIGANPAPEVTRLQLLSNVKISANLPDLRVPLGSATVYVCPIRYGSGLKNKMLEAMAMGLPIVCYPSAITGIECAPGRHLLTANNSADFAAAVNMLLHDPCLAAELGAAARAFAVQGYSWQSRADAFEGLYRRLLAKSVASDRTALFNEQ